jgi:hypothetical protein
MGDGPTEVPMRLMGMCSYCQNLCPVYEQEDTTRSLFLICHNCIADVMDGIELDTKRNEIRRNSGLPPHMQWFLNGDWNNPKP